MKRTNLLLALSLVVTLLFGIFIGSYFFGNSTNAELEENHHEHASHATTAEWTCSMHPQIRMPTFGACPLCGMDLIPTSTSPAIENLSIKMSASAMKLAQVETALVTQSTSGGSLVVTGKIKADEGRISTQTTHTSGRIEKLLVLSTGESVRRGQVVAELYSPALLTAQKELFEAKKIREENPEIFKAAKEKLKNLKLNDRQIQDILARGTVSEHLSLLSDHSGVVLSKKVKLGDHVMEGASLFEVADLSRVWAQFDIYESDLAKVAVGDQISFYTNTQQENRMQGTISFIDPVIDELTRVAKARVLIDNSGHQLKPEQYIRGELISKRGSSRAAIRVPKSALLWTGTRSIVYVKSSTSEGLAFRMREVTTGVSDSSMTEIIAGLRVGEEIAINGVFSIDAAAQLAGKPSMMSVE